MSTTESFIEAVLAGRAAPADIDDWVSAWHDSAGCTDDTDSPAESRAASLDEHLGFTPAEGRTWAANPAMLELIIAAHRARTEGPAGPKPHRSKTAGRRGGKNHQRHPHHGRR